MIDLMTIPATEAERVAYAEGFTRTAALFARIDDLERDNDPDPLRAEIAKLLKQFQEKISKKWTLGSDPAKKNRVPIAWAR